MQVTVIRVRDVMSSPAVTVSPDASLRAVAELLDEQEIGAVVVAGADGMEGIVSERDLVRSLAEGGDPDAVRASEVMGDSPACITPEDTVDDVVAAMNASWVRHLPVLDEDGLVCGVVSARDVLLALA